MVWCSNSSWSGQSCGAGGEAFGGILGCGIGVFLGLSSRPGRWLRSVLDLMFEGIGSGIGRVEEPF